MTENGSLNGSRVPGLPSGEYFVVPPGKDPDVSPGYHSESSLPPELSVIIPTRNESGNIDQLLHRLTPVVLDRRRIEVIFVDDSTDDTPETIRHAATSYICPIRLIHRPAGQRNGGLGGAVLEGIRNAEGRWVVVMDGDLQHPPEMIGEMYDRAQRDTLDLVVASRYCSNGSAESFSLLRSMVSQGSTLAARMLFPGRLRHVDDPMSGFFLVRRAALDLSILRPNGFKILLEIVGKTPHLRIGSVPFSFGERFAGESKASIREGLRFFQLLFTLRFGPNAARFTQFGLVGVSGLLVNTLLLAFWTETIGVYYLASLFLATQGSSLWNFYLSEAWVFRRSTLEGHQLARCGMFLLMNSVALLARGPIVYCLTSIVGVNYLISNVLSMLALLLLRFAIADSLIWKSPSAQAASVSSALPPLTQEKEVAA